MKMLGGPFDGRDIPEARGIEFRIPCRTFHATPKDAEPYLAHTVAVYELGFPANIDDARQYEFVREEVVPDGYLAPTPAATRAKS